MFGLKIGPVGTRRWVVFCANRRGYYSLWIFSVLFALSGLGNFIANDKPLVLSFKNELYFPVITAYPETTFDGVFETETEYRDPFVIDLIENDGWILWPPIRYSYDTINYDLPSPAPSGPSKENWLGTDDQGRDVVARLIYGFRLSVTFGLLLTLGSSVIGVLAGAVQGFFGGWIDLVGQRFIEIWGGLPQLFMLIILASIIEPNFWWLLGLMLLFSWTALIGVVRAEFLRTRNFEYVRAARALGVGTVTIMVRHILPNAMVATLTFVPFILNGSITVLTSLDFLGFGLPPRLCIPGRDARARQRQSACAVARPYRVCRTRTDAQSVDFCRRSSARCIRPTKNIRFRCGMSQLLSIENLSTSFGRGPRESRAVRGVSLNIHGGETVALVGESGSGKSVTALSVVTATALPRCSPSKRKHPG